MVMTMLACAVIAIRAWRLPPFPGQGCFVVMQLAGLWWSGSVAGEHWSSEARLMIFWSEMAWLGVIGAPAAWSLFLWNYVHGGHRAVPRAFHILFSAIALFGWIAALTNDSHHLVYVKTSWIGTPPLMFLDYFHGPLFFAEVSLIYFLMTSITVTILFASINANRIFRHFYIWFAVVSCIPLAINLIYILNVFKSLPLDLTPFTFMLTSCVFYWQISRRQLFDLLPIAHRVLLDAIPDPVLVLDADLRIIECNPASRRLIGASVRIGGALSSVAPELSALNGPGAIGSKVTLGTPPRSFDIEQVMLLHQGNRAGRLLLMRDITQRQKTEDQLHHALAELEQGQQLLREAAIRDPLTGLHNRRFFEEVAQMMLAEAGRVQSPLAAIMLDIDHFKQLNDTYGHRAGDSMLAATGHFLGSQIRQTDAAFRMGGEEFLLLLPRTDEGTALGFAENLRVAFRALKIPFDDGLSLSATVSIGIATTSVTVGTVDDLLRRADAALYRAKAEGRDRVCRWLPAVRSSEALSASEARLLPL